MAETSFRTVPDTNILLASQLRAGPRSPNKEYFDRWRRGEFSVLYSWDTLREYVEKLRDKTIPDSLIKGLVRGFVENGIRVQIEHFHLPVYPVDTDDIAFLLCADNGAATHLISYDRHLRDIRGYYSFKVCGPTDFLNDLRQALEAKGEHVWSK